MVGPLSAPLLQLAQRIQQQFVAGSYARSATIPMLAHYTSVAALRSILRSNEMWLSCVRDMSDISEITGGAGIIAGGLAEMGPSIFQTIPFASMEVQAGFARHRAILETETYALSLCEHGNDAQADRLVMWRAYGGDGKGICLVLRKSAMLGQSAAGRFPIHWSPIEYETPLQLLARLRQGLETVEGAIRTQPAVAAIPPLAIGRLIASVAAVLVLGHKHPAFKDEQELRFVRSPLMSLVPPPSDVVFREVGTSERPKRVFAIPMRNYPEFGVTAAFCGTFIFTASDD